tara:strand:+ start:502 stop:768 length:267 start_codon:yes stop_codon:yes gene_type:complete
MNVEHKIGDLVKIWSPNPTIISKRIPKRLFSHDHGIELKEDEVMDLNHGKIGVVVEIDFKKTDNPIYVIYINGVGKTPYGQHCLREVK